MFSKFSLDFLFAAVVSILFRKYFFQFVLLQFRTDDTDPADVIRLAVADFRFFRHHVEFQPAAFFCLDDAFCTSAPFQSPESYSKASADLPVLRG